MIECRDLKRKDSVLELVGKFRLAEDKIKSAYEELETACNLLKDLTGFSYPSVFPARGGQPAQEVDDVCKELRPWVWRHILNRTQAREFMTKGAYEEFEKGLEKPPPITVETVTDFVRGLHDNLPNMLQDFIDETFEFVMPHEYSMSYKTNQKARYELQKKVIKEGVVNCMYGYPHISHMREQSIQSMDNAFHLMDGKGVSKYPNDALTALREAVSSKTQVIETEYFKFKWYKKGTLHIEFKRDDLIQKINQIAGKDRIKP